MSFLFYISSEFIAKTGIIRNSGLYFRFLL